MVMVKYHSNKQGLGFKLTSSSAGFTLVEIMVVLGLGSLVTAGILSFFIQFYRIGFVNEQRNRINRDIRQLTGELSQVGRQANDFRIYSSIADADRDTAGDQQLDGLSGDFLIFIYEDDSTDNLINGLVGYFRDPESSSEESLGPVRRFEVEFSPGSSASIESLIPAYADLKDSGEVVELSRGLSNGKLFYNFLNRSIMVNGQIYHGNDAKRVTETYNFTISPRG